MYQNSFLYLLFARTGEFGTFRDSKHLFLTALSNRVKLKSNIALMISYVAYIHLFIHPEIFLLTEFILNMFDKRHNIQ